MRGVFDLVLSSRAGVVQNNNDLSGKLVRAKVFYLFQFARVRECVRWEGGGGGGGSEV